MKGLISAKPLLKFLDVCVLTLSLKLKLSSLFFNTEKYFLVYWEDKDSVSVARLSVVQDPPPEKVVVEDTVTIKFHGKLCKGKVAEIGESSDTILCVLKVHTLLYIHRTISYCP